MEKVNAVSTLDKTILVQVNKQDGFKLRKLSVELTLEEVDGLIGDLLDARNELQDYDQ